MIINSSIKFASIIIDWYKFNKRDLPWRNVTDPYYIWLSEILLQQTRVNQGLPYYFKFVDAFPSIFDLAQASETEVLKYWEGLGYYSRARNLHATARYITANLNGKFPDSYEKLLILKGIGVYTASAIASFAYNEHVAVVDGNVSRVLSRYFGINEPINSTQGQKLFRNLAAELLPLKESSVYNQGIMEFGALQCKPASPDCGNCPLSAGCIARKEGIQAELPVKLKSLAKKDRYFNYMVFHDSKGIWLKPRNEKDIWKGLYEFPHYEERKLMTEAALLKKSGLKAENIIRVWDAKKHILSHQNIHSRFFFIKAKIDKKNSYYNDCEYVLNNSVEDFPKPVLIKNFLAECFFC